MSYKPFAISPPPLVRTPLSALMLERELLERLRRTPYWEWPDHITAFVTNIAALEIRDNVILLTLFTDLADGIRRLPEIASLPEDFREYRLSAFWRAARVHSPGPDLLAAFEHELLCWLRGAGRRRRAFSMPVQRVRLQIRERFGEPLTLSVLASVAGRQKQHLATCFRREVGVTVHQYLTHVRMRKAWELIRRGEKIEAVTLLVGYRSKKNFYRHFRVLVGARPSECRGLPLLS
jgi:AraC-like DNA-binding protein